MKEDKKVIYDGGMLRVVAVKGATSFSLIAEEKKLDCLGNPAWTFFDNLVVGEEKDWLLDCVESLIE
jgi:hypothetical protein